MNGPQPTFLFSEQVHFYLTDIRGRSSSWDTLRYESLLPAQPCVFGAGAILSDRYHGRCSSWDALRCKSMLSAQHLFSEQVHFYLTGIMTEVSSWDALRYEYWPSAQPPEQVHFYPTDIHGRSSSWDAICRLRPLLNGSCRIAAYGFVKLFAAHCQSHEGCKNWHVFVFQFKVFV